jgi:hypothetical protein
MTQEATLAKLDEQINEITAKMSNPRLAEGSASTMTRVSGYYRAVKAFHPGKIAEYNDRVEYNAVMHA